MKATQSKKPSFYTDRILGRELKAFPLRKRLAYERSTTARRQKEERAATFDYQHREKETRDPRPRAREIKKAMAENTPLMIVNEIEAGVHLMVFCAGNILSLDVPLETQYLAAHQRINDHHAGLLLRTREETLRLFALCRASIIVDDALAAYRKWKREVASNG